MSIFKHLNWASEVIYRPAISPSAFLAAISIRPFYWAEDFLY